MLMAIVVSTEYGTPCSYQMQHSVIGRWPPSSSTMENGLSRQHDIQPRIEGSQTYTIIGGSFQPLKALLTLSSW